MRANDNQRPWEDTYRFLHPKLDYLPDLGVQFSPEDEADFRLRAEQDGLDYDLIKEKFSMSVQVIPPRPHKIGMELMRKRAIPQDWLADSFRGYLYSKITRARQQNKSH